VEWESDKPITNKVDIRYLKEEAKTRAKLHLAALSVREQRGGRRQNEESWYGQESWRRIGVLRSEILGVYDGSYSTVTKKVVGVMRFHFAV
jgi:hypothetical protein